MRVPRLRLDGDPHKCKGITRCSHKTFLYVTNSAGQVRLLRTVPFPVDDIWKGERPLCERLQLSFHQYKKEIVLKFEGSCIAEIQRTTQIYNTGMAVSLKGLIKNIRNVLSDLSFEPECA